MLQPPALAPLDIALTDELGNGVSLRQLLGKWVVLYFYPKDNTPGCTIESCSLRDVSAELVQLGAVVIGVSRDSAKSHQNFKATHQLPFSLWTDSDHTLLETFGAWGEKKFMGRVFMGIVRSTFIIDPEGKVAKTFTTVTPKNHGEEIVASLKQLQTS